MPSPEEKFVTREMWQEFMDKMNQAFGEWTLEELGIPNSEIMNKTGDTMTGLLRATAGINFSASGGDTLNEYEKGMYLPEIKFGGNNAGMTFSVQSGEYIKIGDIYIVQGRIVLSNKGTSTGNARITLPTQPSEVAFMSFIDPTIGFSGLQNWGYLLGGASATTNEIFILRITTTGRSTVSDAIFTDTSDLRFNIIYF